MIFRNVFALKNLFNQLPKGPQMEMAREAMQVCPARQKQEQE
jgi:hypothetical protein